MGSLSVRVRQGEARGPLPRRRAIHVQARHPTQRQRDMLLAVGAEEVHDEAVARSVILERLLAARMPDGAIRPHERVHRGSFLVLLLQHVGSKFRSMDGTTDTIKCSSYLALMTCGGR